jgi:formamidopyrimidine-DNA glycosylase
VLGVWQSNHAKYKNQHLPNLLGKRLEGIERYGKVLVWDFEEWEALNHLGMTGIWHMQETLENLPPHAKVAVQLGTEAIVFVDPRTFGRYELLKEGTAKLLPIIAKQGPDIVRGFDAALLAKQLKHRRGEIGRVLLDSKVVAGCGNIYKSESLYRAGIHPQRSADSLSAQECLRLAEALQAVAAEALERGGSSIRDFRNIKGYAGLMQNSFGVYNRKGLPCRLCRSLILSIKQGDRSSFFCEQCQI